MQLLFYICNSYPTITVAQPYPTVVVLHLLLIPYNYYDTALSCSCCSTFVTHTLQLLWHSPILQLLVYICNSYPIITVPRPSPAVGVLHLELIPYNCCDTALSCSCCSTFVTHTLWLLWNGPLLQLFYICNSYPTITVTRPSLAVAVLHL